MSNDIEIWFCNQRCEVDSIGELVERVTRDDIAVDRKRAILRTLERVVLEEIATANTRHTPYYDRSLAMIVDRGVVLRRYVEEPASIRGFSSDDLFPILVDFELAQHRRACDLLDAALADGARLLSDVWDVSPALELVLGLLPAPEVMLEPIRRFVLVREARGADHTTGAYIDAAMAASRGTGSWDAVERAFAAWETAHAGDGYSYDDSALDWLDWMSRLPRHRATFADVCRGLRGSSVDEIRRGLGNPFEPATRWVA
jgi:hypothetical protein